MAERGKKENRSLDSPNSAGIKQAHKKTHLQAHATLNGKGRITPENGVCLLGFQNCLESVSSFDLIL